MKCRNKCGLVLLFLGAASLSLQGCVRLNFETRGDCIGLPEAPAFEQQTELKYKIMVSRFENSTDNTEIDANRTPDDVLITSNDVRIIFDHATNVLRCGEDNENATECAQFDDVQGDFACKVQLERKGPVDRIPRFTLPEQHPFDCAKDGEICSEKDLLAVWNADPAEGIKVVKNVRYCQGILEGEDSGTGTFGPWVGCGQLPGRSMAVERVHKDIEGILWPHEYGHAKGLQHSEGQSCALNDDPKGLMSPEIWKTQTKLSGQECFAFREGQP